MPSTMTHAYMAHDIFNNLNDNLKEKFKPRLGEYLTYSQGADILYFYPIIPPFIKCFYIKRLAGVVHRQKVNKFFISLVKEVKKDKKIDKFIWLSGLVTHYVGDSICHPFVNYKEYDMRLKTNKKKDYHFLTEAYIDNYILNLKGEYYKTFKGYDILKTRKNKNIENMLDKCFLEIFNEKNMGKIYFKSLRNMRFLFNIIRYDPYKIKRIFYSILYFFLPFLYRDIRFFSYHFNLNEKDNNYFLNLNHDIWFNVRKKDVIYTKSFIDLYKEVIVKGTHMIEILYDYIYNDKPLDLEKFFGNLSYANGLPIKE